MEQSFIYNTPQMILAQLELLRGIERTAAIEHPYVVRKGEIDCMFRVRKIFNRLDRKGDMLFGAFLDPQIEVENGKVYHVMVKGSLDELAEYVRQVDWQMPEIKIIPNP